MDSRNTGAMTTGPAPGIRRISNWINAFVEYTEPLYAPPLFRKWAGASILAGAMERRIWAHTRGRVLYPNLYVLLVGPPGTGKSLVMADVRRFWSSLTGFHIAPNSLTSASLADVIVKAQRKIVRPAQVPPFVEYHSLLAAVSEFSEFASEYDSGFMSRLQVLYDCEELSELRRGKPDGLKVENTQLNLLAGTTPSYLNGFMPEGAWDQGFISRTILVFSEAQPQISLFDAPVNNDKLYEDLKADLRSVSELFGQISWEPAAAQAIQQWVNNGQEPVPEHRRLMHYNSRRIAHLIKLSMIMAISKRSELVISAQDFGEALDMLMEAEHYMTGIFKAMAAGGEQAIEDTYHWLVQNFKATSKPTMELEIIQFMKDRMPVHAIEKSFEVMKRAGMLKLAKAGAVQSMNEWVPLPRTVN